LLPLIDPGFGRSIRLAPIVEGRAMPTETKDSNLSTILWTAGALAIVVVLAVYMGMN
jgi:hypothetical protein